MLLIVVLTPLLRYNSHTIQFTHLKYTIQRFLLYSQICATITTILELFHPLKKKPHGMLGPTPLRKHSSSSPCISASPALGGWFHHGVNAEMTTERTVGFAK